MSRKNHLWASAAVSPSPKCLLAVTHSAYFLPSLAKGFFCDANTARSYLFDGFLLPVRIDYFLRPPRLAVVLVILLNVVLFKLCSPFANPFLQPTQDYVYLIPSY